MTNILTMALADKANTRNLRRAIAYTMHAVCCLDGGALKVNRIISLSPSYRLGDVPDSSLEQLASALTRIRHGVPADYPDLAVMTPIVEHVMKCDRVGHIVPRLFSANGDVVAKLETGHITNAILSKWWRDDVSLKNVQFESYHFKAGVPLYWENGLDGAEFRYCDLRKHRFGGKLDNVEFYKCDMRETNFDFADINSFEAQDCNFSGSMLEINNDKHGQREFKRCDLTGCNFNDANLHDWEFEHCTFTDATFGDAEIENAKLTDNHGLIDCGTPYSWRVLAIRTTTGDQPYAIKAGCQYLDRESAIHHWDASARPDRRRMKPLLTYVDEAARQLGWFDKPEAPAVVQHSPPTPDGE